MTTQLSPTQATDLLIDCLQANLVPLLTGSPGIGKSDVIRKIASHFNLKVIDLRLSQSDPTDLNGFPTIDKETGKASYMPMDTFPIVGDELPSDPKEGNGWLLFLDELTSAPQMVQAASYKLILDRAVGLNALHPNCYIVAAGNKMDDNAIVEEMGTALQSRMVHLEMGVDTKAWLEWGRNNGVDYRITSFIDYSPSSLYVFSPDHDDKTFRCPRTWVMASELLKLWPDSIPAGKRPLIAGTIGEAGAAELVGFCKIFGQLPTAAEIAANPKTTRMPEEQNQKFATAGTVANHTTEANATNMMIYVSRMDIEFQIICVKEMMKRNLALLEHDAIQDWLNTNASKLK